MIAVTKLRVVRSDCSRLRWRAATSLHKHTQMRMKIISVYFKSLYSRSEEVVQVAYESLKTVLSQQSKLPKGFASERSSTHPDDVGRPQSPHRLGLEGLARLLQLLTNYFKVEIGTKLLDH